MLMYHPAQDINHCIYRLLLILENSNEKEINLNLYKIQDFYLLFPHLLKNLAPFPSQLRAFKGIFDEIPEPYESIQNLTRVIYELDAIQTLAIHSLIAKKFLELESFRDLKLKRTSTSIPKPLNDILMSDPTLTNKWFEAIVHELPKININGTSGLKKRSGLMEYRYDLEEK